ncbi:hypothetical protein DVK85_09835 [Flavobacterium arcticum]|uniref:Uncharacterized protein n=1 Tax=Flavobacterium arcticum TaxID=1784713 RepID=A0A345HD58_9FLAO|nr:hypothetical protein [Flavobacterium arcticum]AXG74518.1 hypothetical protein DVK85_09835 [Flavobacterium arcticum]KAF2512361.1 hypothetical protein E0W72_03825 [Flavobacterium arcticum]
MKKVFYLPLAIIVVFTYSCSTEDTVSKTETEAVVNEQEFVAKNLDKNALTNATVELLKGFSLNIDFTKLFTYNSDEEATKEIQKTLESIKEDIEWDISDYPESNAVVFRFSLDNGVGRLSEYYYINTENNKVIKSIINDGNNNLIEIDTLNTIDQINLKRNAVGWSIIDTNDPNLFVYKQFEVIADIYSMKVFATK